MQGLCMSVKLNVNNLKQLIIRDEDNDELNIKMIKYFEFLQKKTGFKIKFISKTLYKK